jgi:MFS family permease
MRAWRILGVLILIGAEALLYGYSYPFFSLALERYGLATWLIGLNASLAGAGILIVGPALPQLIERLGLKVLVASLFGLSLASFAAMLVTDNLVVWFLSRFVMGACFAALWTTTEIWLNGVVDEKSRGRIIGASGTLYAACQFVGPMVLGAVGVDGRLPILVAMAPLALGVVMALLIRPAYGAAEEDENLTDTRSLRFAVKVAGALVAAAFLGGIGETAMQALLPLYGLAHGVSESGAAHLVAVFSLGEAILVAALGWMADRYGRKLTLLTCSIGAAATCLALPFAVGSNLTLFPVLFIAGGAISGIYMLGVILMGQDFRGQQLAYVSTGFAMAYAAGSVVGSTPVGYLVDVFGPEALPLSIAAGFIALTVFLALPARRRVARPSAAAALESLPEITFDLSFLTEPAPAVLHDRTASAIAAATTTTAAAEVADISFDLSFLTEGRTPSLVDEGETIHVEQAEVGDLQVRDHRERKERNLEEWFRQRAAEVARCAAERYQGGAHGLEGLKAY